MRTVDLGPKLVVFVSAVWQTTSTAVRIGSDTVLIDSVVHPDELAAVRTELDGRGWAVSRLLITHGDWDHLFSRGVYPETPVTFAESTFERLRAAPGEAQVATDAFDAEQYITGRAPIELGRPLEVVLAPGSLELGGHRIEMVPTPGHTGDGCALHLPWLETLVCGDYLSPVEIPMLNASGSVDAYAETLDRLEPRLGAVRTVIPGHGAPISAERAHAILLEDRAYVAGLIADPVTAVPPASRMNVHQQTIHAANLAHLGA